MHVNIIIMVIIIKNAILHFNDIVIATRPFKLSMICKTEIIVYYEPCIDFIRYTLWFVI